jgi:U5 small nuclear ribonucleoprotein component
MLSTLISSRFMLDLMEHPSMIRNVMVAGHLHHGKTSLLDMLVLETHQLTWDADEAVSGRSLIVDTH